MTAQLISIETRKHVTTPMDKLKRAVLRILKDDYLHSIAELAKDLDANRKDVQAALLGLRRDNKVFTMRRRWSII